MKQMLRITDYGFKYDYSDEWFDYKRASNQIVRTIKKDIPVILHVVGKTNYTGIIPMQNARKTGLHNVNIVKIVRDDILDKTMVYCSSWSKMICIDFKVCWEAIAYADETLGVGGHWDIDWLLSFFMDSQHAIVYMDKE